VKYPTVFDGEGIELRPRRRSKRAWQLLRVACCDCGLIHTLAFAIERNGNLGIAVRIEKRRTAAHRRAAQFKGLRLPKRK
jgi:hypothetical protein